MSRRFGFGSLSLLWKILLSTSVALTALFLVTDPRGRVIASLGGAPSSSLSRDLPVVRTAASQFPRQATGFMERDGHLFQIAVTPVYVESVRGQALLNVLVAGYAIDA